MMRGAAGFALAIALLPAAMAPAQAACSTAPLPPPPVVAPGAPLADRYAALMAADKFSDAAGQAERWKAFIVDAQAAGGFDPARLARAQVWYAYALEYADKADLALPEAEKALAMIEAAKLTGTPLHVEALANLAMLATDEGQPDRGRALAEQALELGRQIFGEDAGEMHFVHNALGTVAYAQGRYAEAEAEYGLASRVAERCLPANDAFIVNHMASHAGTLYMVGRTEDALAENQRAARWALANLPESNPTITLALGNLGTLLHAAGRNAEAEAAMRKVVDLEGRYQPESWFYRAISLSNFASVIDAQGRHEEAEAYWLKSLEFHGRATIKRDPVIPAFPLRYAADAAQERGELQIALERRTQAVSVLEANAPADNPERALAQIELALTMLRLGQAREALVLAQPAMETVRAKLGETNVKRMNAEIGLARLLAANGDREAAYALARVVAGRLETRLLDAATRRNDLVRYGPAFSGSFSAVTVLALETGRLEDAFHFLQLANLSDIVVVTSEVAARAAAFDAASAARIREFQNLLATRRDLDRQRSFALSREDAGEQVRLGRLIEESDARIAAAGSALDRDFPDFRRMGRPAPVSLAAFRARLQPGQALLAPLLVEDATVVIAVTRDGLAWHRADVPRSAVVRDIQAIRAAIRAGQEAKPGTITFDFAAARRLGKLLLAGDPGKAVAGHETLLWHASGPLAGLPAALLVTSDRGLDKARRDPGGVDWLVKRHAIAVIPALAGGETDAGGGGGPRGFLGIGAPVLRREAKEGGGGDEAGTVPGARSVADLPELPDAGPELREMAAAFPAAAARVLTGEQASELVLREVGLERYGVLAFATHGLEAGEVAGLTEPALVLSTPAAGETVDDGLLTASEIARLRLDADWVILSACNTASGDGAGGTTFGGLAAAFTRAGARALLVSHWPVRDDVAARLTTRTLAHHAAGASRAQALRKAILEVIADPAARAADPSAWAPFVVIER